MADDKFKNNKKPEKNPEEIFQAPEFTREPSNQQIKFGQKLTLRASATGVPIPSFQWYHKGQKVSGANSDRYMVAKSRREHAGSYFCEAKNFVGKLVSREVMVTFFNEKLPDIVITPEKASIEIGKPFKLEIANLKKSEMEGMTFQWSFNDKRISGATKPVLEFEAVKQKYAGEYKLVVTKNATAGISNVATLAIQEPLSKDDSDFAMKFLEKEMATISQLAPAPVKEAAPPQVSSEESFFDPEELNDEYFFIPDENEEEQELPEETSAAAVEESTEEIPVEKTIEFIELDTSQTNPEIVPDTLFELVQEEVHEVAKEVVQGQEVIAPKVPDESLMKRKLFLERLLLASRVLRDHVPQHRTNPLEEKISRQRNFLLKLREGFFQSAEARKRRAA